MSADKRRRQRRAFEWLRRRRSSDGGPARINISGRPPPEVRWLVENGHGAVRRLFYSSGRSSYAVLRRNYFVEA